MDISYKKLWNSRPTVRFDDALVYCLRQIHIRNRHAEKHIKSPRKRSLSARESERFTQ